MNASHWAAPVAPAPHNTDSLEGRGHTLGVVHCNACALGTQTKAPATRAVRNSLVRAVAIIGTMMLGAVILYGVTGWLWLVVHQGLR